MFTRKRSGYTLPLSVSWELTQIR